MWIVSRNMSYSFKNVVLFLKILVTLVLSRRYKKEDKNDKHIEQPVRKKKTKHKMYLWTLDLNLQDHTPNESIVLTKNSRKTRSTTVVDPWHLKDEECDVSLTRNCCITVIIYIISSNKIQFTGLCHFDQAHPKIIESTFSFPEFVPACSVFETQSILEFCDLTGHNHFWSCSPNNFFW